MDKLGISVNSLFPIDITGAMFAEILRPCEEAPRIELDGNLRLSHLKPSNSTDFIARLGVRSLHWRWELGWKLQHHRASTPSEVLTAISNLSQTLAQVLENSSTTADTTLIISRGNELVDSIVDTDSKEEAVSAILKTIFQKITNREPTIALFESTIKSENDWRFSRLIQYMKLAGEGTWKFHGGGKLIRSFLGCCDRETFTGFKVSQSGDILLIGARSRKVDKIFTSKQCRLSLKGPLKYLAVRANKIPHLPWYFQHDDFANAPNNLDVVEYIAPPVTSCQLRQTSANRWSGPTGYSLIDYDHENCRSLISALIGDKLRNCDIDYWQKFLTRLPASGQRIMKSQQFVNSWVENEIHRLRHPKHWKLLSSPVEVLSKLMLGPSLVEHGSILDYFRAVYWKNSRAEYADFYSEKENQYIDRFGVVKVEYFFQQIHKLLHLTFDFLTFLGCPRYLHTRIKVASFYPKQTLCPKMRNMNANTHHQLMIAKRALAQAAKLYYEFMSFFLSTVLKADFLLLYLLMGEDTRKTITKLAGTRSVQSRVLKPIIWERQ